jgi:outer membrane protein OmpA-like peptidoglycan-associated protein
MTTRLFSKLKGVSEMSTLRGEKTLALGLSAWALVACGAAAPPPELVDARKAVDKASAGQAAQLAPAQLDTAKQALQKAEASWEEEGSEDPRTKDLAYIAQCRAEIADAEAARVKAEQDRKLADKDFKESQLDALKATKSTVEQTKAEAEKTKAQLESEKRALDTEKKARAEAEKRSAEAEKKLAAAMASLQEIAKVKEEARGMVITLSGAVLFATGKSTLLPIAQEKINEVAKALKDQGYKSLLVEGHTDAQGSAEKNQVLSQQRAEAVRSQLMSQGIPSEKIRAQGIGSSRPVADNSSAEGRANNRRVEIIVEPFK